MNSVYGNPICHVLLTVQNTPLIGKRPYSSTADNLLDFYINKTRQHLETDLPNAVFLWLITQLQMTWLDYLVYPEGSLMNRLAFRTNRIIQSPLIVQWVNNGSISGTLCVLGSWFPWKVNAKSTRDQLLVKWSSVLGMLANHSRQVSRR